MLKALYNGQCFVLIALTNKNNYETIQPIYPFVCPWFYL